VAAIATLNPLKPSAVPSAGETYEVHLRGWLTEALQEGQAFLSNCYGYGKTDEIIRAIMGETYEDKLRPREISNLTLNQTGKIGLDLASSLTDIKPFWAYKTNNVRFERTAEMAQKLASAWYPRRLIDLKFCDVIKFSLAAGTGYAHNVYNEDMQDLDLQAEDPRDVIPIRPSDNYSIQNAFGVAIRRERTVNYLKHLYPEKAGRIKADRSGSYAGLSQQTTAQRLVESLGLSSGFMQNLWAAVGGRPHQQLSSIPTADLFTIYVKDDSLNQTGSALLMGEPHRNWSYIVQPGEPLYPRKRAITMTSSCILRDGPSIYWHGLFPLAKLTLDPWPYSRAWLGKSPLRDLLTIQREIDQTARGIADKFQKCWRPDLVADKTVLSKAGADRIDTRRAGLRINVKPSAGGKGFELVEPNMQGATLGMEWLKLLVEAAKELSGTQELTSLVQLGQIPSSETIERMIESWSPAIRLRSRVMEAFMREMAMMVLSNFFQFYTIAQRVASLGPAGLDFADADHDPGTLIPDFLDRGWLDLSGSPLPRPVRAKAFLDEFTYEMAPGSLLAASEVTDKLMYLQLSRMGFVDPLTLLEKLGINNIAPASMKDQAGTTIMERLQWAQSVGLSMAVGPAGASAAGRKATAQQMPRMTVKES